MTLKEKSDWSRQLLDKVLQIGEQGQHYVNIDVNNCGYGITVCAMRGGFDREKEYDIHQFLGSYSEEKDFQELMQALDELLEKEDGNGTREDTPGKTSDMAAGEPHGRCGARPESVAGRSG